MPSCRLRTVNDELCAPDELHNVVDRANDRAAAVLVGLW